MTIKDDAGYISYVGVDGKSRKGSEGMAYFERMLARSKETIGGNGIKSPATQISGNTFTVADGYCRFLMDTSGLAASDTLNTLATSGTLHDGQLIGLSINNSSRIVNISHSVGNIKTLTGRTVTLRDTDSIFWAIWDESNSVFRQVMADHTKALDRIIGRKAIATVSVATGSATPTAPICYLNASGAQNLDLIAQDNFPEDEANLLCLTSAPGSGAITVRHNIAGTGNNLKIVLQDATNFVLAPGVTLVLRKESTQWTEIGRIQPMPAGTQGSIPVGSSAGFWSQLAAPSNNQMKLVSATGAGQKMAWSLDQFAGYRVLAPASNPIIYNLGLYDESWMTFDLTTGGAIVNLPDFAASLGKEWCFYLGVNPNGRAVTINCPTAGNTMGKNGLTSIQLSTVGDLVCIQTDGTANAKISIDSRSTVVKPTSLGKLKNVDQGTYQSASVMLNNGAIVQAGLSIGLARGSVDGINQFGPAEWDPINPPPAGTSIADWVFTGSNLFVVLSNGWVYGAGQNAGGQLGQADTTARFILTRIPYFFNNSLTVTKVYAACNGQADATMASVYFVTSANKVYAVGNNAGGQLGNGNTSNISTPVQVFDAGALSTTVSDIQISLTTYANGYAAILLANGNLYMCGNNVAGALGQGNTINLTTFTQVSGVSNVTMVKLYGGNNGTTFCQTAMALTSAASGSLFVWGYNASFQGANGGTANKTSPGTAILTNVKDAGFVGGTVSYGCYGLKNDGTLFTWGEGANNILFGANTTTIQSPTQKFTGTAVKVWSFIFGASITLPAIGLLVLDNAGKLHISGTGTTAMPFPVLQNTNYASGAYYAALPKELSDGTDSISDIYIFNNAGVNPMAFILTTNGAIYAGGGGAATSAPLCKGHVVTTTTEATNVYLYRLNKHLWE